MRVVLSKVRSTLWVRVLFAATVGAASALHSQLPRSLAAGERASLAAGLQERLDNLAKAERQLPHDTFDTASVIEQAGRDPARLEAWVRQRTAWVPYQGALRGARGVLMDRVGNSLDRSLLLAELLRSAGFTVRLARGELTEIQATQLIASAGAADPGAVEAASPPSADGDRRGRALEQADRLETLLGAAAGVRGDAPALALAAAREHWWVQRQTADGWVDADPTFGEGRAAGSAPVETFPFDGRDGTISLPSQFVHEVGIKVVIEVWNGGKLADHTVLEAGLRPAELLGQRVVLRHFPLNSPGIAVGADEKAMKTALLAEREWLPVLAFGPRHVAHKSFTDAGKLNESPNLDPASKLAKATGGLFGGLGGGLGGGGDAPEVKTSILTAEWLDYEVRTPGRPPQTIRREVFDHLGPAARAAAVNADVGEPQIDDAKRLERALVLAGTTESHLVPCHPSREFQLHLLAQELLDRKNLWLRMAAEPDPARRAALAGGIDPSGPIHFLGIARQTLNPSVGQTFPDVVNILNYRTHLRPLPQGSFVAHQTIDVVTNGVGVAPHLARQAFRLRLRQGVADTVAEDLVLGGDPDALNTSRLLEQARAQGIGLAVLRDPASNTLAEVSLSPDVRARISQDLGRGFVVVLPEKPVSFAGANHIGWWRVDPITGQTIGVMDSGFHAATVEKGVLEDTQISRTVVRFRPGRTSSFWNRHPSQIAQEAGFKGNFNEVVSLICDLQADLLKLGML